MSAIQQGRLNAVSDLQKAVVMIYAKAAMTQSNLQSLLHESRHRTYRKVHCGSPT
jgi:hypothetical protein